MTRYELRDRHTGTRYPDSPTFDSATEAVIWAADHSVPAHYWPYPVKGE